MWRDFFTYAADLGGPVRVDTAAAAAGLTVGRIRGRADREGWWRPYRDVVAPPGTPVRPETWALAALARARGPRPDAPEPVALTRWSAAAAYGVHRSWPTAVQLLVADHRRLRAGRRFAPVRARGDVADGFRRTGTHDLTVVSASRLVCDLAAVTEVARLTTLTIDLVQQRHLRLEELEALLLARPRFAGRPRVVAVLQRLGEVGRVDSGTELEFRRRLVAAGIPLDAGQVRVECRDGVPIHFDLGIAHLFLGLEIQSMLAHATRAQLLADTRRANELTRLPDVWRVVRATVEDLDDRWPDFLALVRETVAEQSRRFLGRSWP